MSLSKERVSEGLCPVCGDFSYPYYYCTKHRIKSNISRITRKLEKEGVLDVTFDKDGEKMMKIKDGFEFKDKRNYSASTIKKMQLPRLNGKPMDDNLILNVIHEVIIKNKIPLTEKEINDAIKQLKTNHKVIPVLDDLIYQYKSIQNKKSLLPKKSRMAIELRINFLLSIGRITKKDLE